MSIFQSRRSGDESLRARLDELEQAHQELAREHEEVRARYEQQLEIVWLVAIPSWLREWIERAQSSGWTVTRSPAGVVFDRLDAEEARITVSLPLPDDGSKALDALQSKLRVSIMSYEVRAA